VCGIAGALQLDGGPPPTDLVARMNSAQAHRGPDGEGLLTLGAAALGHRRLAVIDLSERAAQPMHLEAQGLALTYNGEVYNYRELREELEQAGETFRSESDTEVVLRAYARWGEDAFARFNGMWALALWDSTRRRLVLARDRFGIKPLYVLEDSGRLYFASEPKALLAAVPEAREPDAGVLGRFLLTGVQDDCPRTFFARIRRVAPGTLLTVDVGGGREEKTFWSFSADEARERYSGSPPAETLRALLTDAVALRLRSDVPVGTCLSGGLDSSSVVALAAGRSQGPVRTFTAVYDQPGYDERAYAHAVAERFGCQASEISPSPGSHLTELVDVIGWFHDEPCGRPGLITQWHVMALAAGQVKVLLDGQGGDELLLGYASHALPYLASLGRETGVDRAQVLKLIRDSRGLLGQPSTSPEGPGSLFSHLARAALRRARGRGEPPPLAPALADAAAHVEVERTPGGGISRIDRVLRDALAYDSIPALLHHEDRASMAFSLEARVPFLDHRVVEFALSLDFRKKVEGALTKAILRRALADLLPEPVLARTDKLGYPTPLADWLRADAENVKETLLFGFSERGYVSARDVEASWRAFEGGRGDAWLLYRWLTTELWLQRFVDRPPSPPCLGPASPLRVPTSLTRCRRTQAPG
jgi:asparagine synthase (glutamine-hydrolysing)